MEGVHRIRNKIFTSNTYVYIIPNTDECFIIDPGLDFDSIDQFLIQNGLKPIVILCTHGHFDHVGSAQKLKQKYHAKIALHAGDLKVAKSANFLLMACKIEHRIQTPIVDFEMKGENIQLDVNAIPIQWIHIPGHTVGSCVILLDNYAFTGDSIYRNGVGLVDFPGEDKQKLKESILNVWDRLPESCFVYPGHGGADTWGNIKRRNAALREFLGMEVLEGSFTSGSIHEG